MGLALNSIIVEHDIFFLFFAPQAIGHDEGLILMERADPLLLLVSLPLVPVGLVLGKMIRWEDAVSHPLSVNGLLDNKFKD